MKVELFRCKATFAASLIALLVMLGLTLMGPHVLLFFADAFLIISTFFFYKYIELIKAQIRYAELNYKLSFGLWLEERCEKASQGK